MVGLWFWSGWCWMWVALVTVMEMKAPISLGMPIKGLLVDA